MEQTGQMHPLNFQILPKLPLFVLHIFIANRMHCSFAEQKSICYVHYVVVQSVRFQYFLVLYDL